MSKSYQVFERGLDTPPVIERVYNEVGMSWREAKGNVRNWYLQGIKRLRSTTEREYFKDTNLPNVMEDQPKEEEIHNDQIS